ncbi:MAG: ATP-binding protein, partial [Planctomycetota bacterium]|nr:ATP-binding protein [Planctomycetota bacterium]
MDPVMPKRFNIAGPCIPNRHYLLPVIARLPEARLLAKQGDYFVIHAARQSGKTTFLHALTDEINAEGQFYALHCSLEELQGITDMTLGIYSIVDGIQMAMEYSPMANLRANANQPKVANATPTTLVRRGLTQLCIGLDKPPSIFFDEVDCLSGQALITFLRQLRDGYNNRARIPFPWSIALVGMRDI